MMEKQRITNQEYCLGTMNFYIEFILKIHPFVKIFSIAKIGLTESLRYAASMAKSILNEGLSLI